MEACRLGGTNLRRLGVVLLGSLVGLVSAMGFSGPWAAASVTEFTLPTGVYPGGGLAAGPDGALWFTASKGGVGQIGRLTTSGTYSEFALPGPRPQYDGLSDIASGPDGRLWFTEFDANKIGAITPDGVVTEYSTGLTPRAGPSGITAGADGRLWFTEWYGGKIGAITTAGVITEYPLPDRQSEPSGITAGPYGNVWFTERRGQAIGYITAGGVISERLANHEYPNYAPLGAITSVGNTLWVGNSYSGQIGRSMPPSTCPSSSGLVLLSTQTRRAASQRGPMARFGSRTTVSSVGSRRAA